MRRNHRRTGARGEAGGKRVGRVFLLLVVVLCEDFGLCVEFAHLHTDSTYSRHQGQEVLLGKRHLLGFCSYCSYCFHDLLEGLNLSTKAYACSAPRITYRIPL
ncbi:hypothetical protein BCR37DRAFT_230319 [Protomyces lactucae-debilis]|uniref:Uncharacterized protein n=1 Tax=Protomyces lactucae-debilis TaxID=2754530 RepID=A0A1Y2ES39_PROLT|nr:uncharacterized protein BCR37DRAFT_230319 [Protomyces lactucae-debilis]ORY73665.1 hypothetical protein BCR37DRAFT_230319 [Protomyces lactucae-debilis]